MIHYKSNADLEIMRESCRVVELALSEVAKFLKPGVTTKQADKLAEQVIRDNKGVPSFLNYRGYPFASCISVNDAVVHGFPSNDVLKDGDIVSVDLGVFKNGFHGDYAYTFALGEISEEVQQLMRITKESLYKGIEKAHHGNRIGDIAFAIQDYTERKYGYGVVRELVGHGLGRSLHEDPQVPNFGKRGTGPKLKEGMTIAIEPMINMGVKEVYYDTDGWTVRTKDGKPSAHYEHNVCVKKGKAEILSSFKLIEEAELANENLNSKYLQAVQQELVEQ
ncbi:type I methionyl aminopeptidase [Aridibaculum aurantiacum]|uniref:type I methionyl aminopeptidase n=1 Tax=Aridibaculum aurantiacum TaxID=2810307 RepID=UPI001A96AE80|nr:type I methionyl aminopeptidase [Aridibaculum aurantiacum]